MNDDDIELDEFDHGVEDLAGDGSKHLHLKFLNDFSLDKV